MKIENLKITYSEYRREMKGLPPGKNRSSVKARMSDWLESIRDMYGQDVVNQVVRKK